MLKSTISGLERALNDLRTLEQLARIDDVLDLFDALNSDPLDEERLETAALNDTSDLRATEPARRRRRARDLRRANR